MRLESARAVREELFWELAEEMYVDPAVELGTMMGFPCLRVSGQFFASLQKDTAELIVKLAERRVDDLIDSGEGRPFAPNGRRFREWVTVRFPDEVKWRDLLGEAKKFALPESV